MKPVRVLPHILLCIVGFENNLGQMIIMTRQCVSNKNHIASSKVKVIVCTLALFIGYNESLVYPAHNCVLHGRIQNYMPRRSVACKDYVASLKAKVGFQI